MKNRTFDEIDDIMNCIPLYVEGLGLGGSLWGVLATSFSWRGSQEAPASSSAPSWSILTKPVPAGAHLGFGGSSHQQPLESLSFALIMCPIVHMSFTKTPLGVWVDLQHYKQNFSFNLGGLEL